MTTSQYEREPLPTSGLPRRRLLTLAAATTAYVAFPWPILVSDSAIPPLPQRPITPPLNRPSRGPRSRLDVVAHSLSGGHITTIEEFREAQRRGATIIDTDVHRSSDGLVVVHDRSTYIGPPEGRASATLNQLLGIPTLDDAYDALLPGRKLALDVKEVVPGWGSPRETMFRILAMLHRHPERQAATCIWLGDPRDVAEFAHYMPDVQVGLSRSTYSATETEQLIRSAQTHGANALSIRFQGLQNDRGRELVQLAHECGLYVYCWDLHSVAEYRAAARLGVDAITVDEISAARQLSDGLSL